MIKTTFARRFQTIVLSGFFAGILLVSNRSDAQGQWLPEQDAIDALNGEITTLYHNLELLVPGTSDYANTNLHMSYFLLIFRNIEIGLPVEDALYNALTTMPLYYDLQTGVYAPGTPLPKSVIKGLHDEGVDLLTN